MGSVSPVAGLWSGRGSTFDGLMQHDDRGSEDLGEDVIGSSMSQDTTRP
jgi:hypothetical protein